jgi:hypothetical protein
LVSAENRARSAAIVTDRNRAHNGARAQIILGSAAQLSIAEVGAPMSPSEQRGALPTAPADATMTQHAEHSGHN